MDWLFYWRVLVILQWMAILHVYSLDDTQFEAPCIWKRKMAKRKRDYG